MTRPSKPELSSLTNHAKVWADHSRPACSHGTVNYRARYLPGGTVQCWMTVVCFCRASQHRDNPLSTALPRSWLRCRIFWRWFGLLSKFFDLLWYMWIKTTKTISGKLLAVGFAATLRLLSNYFDLLYLLEQMACKILRHITSKIAINDNVYICNNHNIGHNSETESDVSHFHVHSDYVKGNIGHIFHFP